MSTPPSDQSQPLTTSPLPDQGSQESRTNEMARTLLPHLTSSLKAFTASSRSFQILYTHPPTRLPPPSVLPLQELYVLDSSFNPPSAAHAWLGKDAVLSAVKTRRQRCDVEKGTTMGEAWEGIRLLLLLATQNADKPSKPVEFEERLAMMVLMARNLYAELVDVEEGGGLGMFMVDVGVIKQPYFVDKAAAIDESAVYGERGRFEQIHLTGYDTLMRIFDKKYYGDKGLDVLRPFLENGRIRAVLRPGKDWGDLEEQRRWGEKVRNGDFEGEGLKREWADRVELVEDEEGIVGGVSSTKVREGVSRSDWMVVEELVGREVMEWIRERSLYMEGEKAKV